MIKLLLILFIFSLPINAMARVLVPVGMDNSSGQFEIAVSGDSVSNQTQADYTVTDSTSESFVKNKPSLSTVATTGAYSDLTGKPSIPSGTVTSIAISSTDLSVSGSPIASSGTIIANLVTSGITAGTYADVTVTNKGIATAGFNRSFAYPTRSLNTAFQINTIQDASVTYTVDIACTLSLTTGQSGTVTLQYADDSAFTTNVKTIQSSVNANTGSLTIGLNLIQTSTASLTGIIPAGKYVKIITTNNTGTPTFTYRTAQEVLL